MNYRDELSKILDECVTTGAVADFTGGTYVPEKGKKKKKRKKKKSPSSPSIFESYNDNYHRQMDHRNRTDGQADETLQFEDAAEESRIPGHQVSVEPTEEGRFVLSIEGPAISLAESFSTKEKAMERLDEVRDELGERKSDINIHNKKDAQKAGVRYAEEQIRELKNAGGDFNQWAEDLLSKALMTPEYNHLLADLEEQSPLGVNVIEAEEAFVDGINYALSHKKTKRYLGIEDDSGV